MIYIVEVPHQRPAFCWVARSESEAIAVIDTTFSRCGETPDYGASFDEWLEYNGQDLHAQYVFMSDEEALKGLKELGGHQSGWAYAALLGQLICYGAHPDTDTAITHAVVQIGYCVFGVGSSRDEAVADAAKWIPAESGLPGISVDEVESRLVSRHGAAHGQTIVMRCDDPDFDSYLESQGGFKQLGDSWFVETAK